MATLSITVRQTITKRKIELVSLTLLILATIFLFVPVLNHVMTPDSDYGIHIDYLRRLLDGSDSLRIFLIRLPHFLFQLSTLIVYTIVPVINLTTAGFIVMLLGYIALGVVIYAVLRMYLGRPTTYATGIVYALAALVIMLVTPVNMFTPTNMYFGYLPINVYHNPTMTMLKPFAVVLFFCSARTFDPEPITRPMRLIGLYAILTVFCILAKPNFVIIVLPALAFVTLYRLLRRQSIHWPLLIGGIVLPAGLLLGLQSVALQSNSSIIVAPLAVLRAWDVYNPLASSNLVGKLLLSILFPLAVYGLYWRQAVRSTYLNLAWVTFVVGALYTYILAEGGRRLAHGNLTWSSQIGLFVLFAASLVFFLMQNKELLAGLQLRRVTPAFAIGLIVLGLHLMSGIIWYQIYAGSAPMGDIIAHIW